MLALLTTMILGQTPLPPKIDFYSPRFQVPTIQALANYPVVAIAGPLGDPAFEDRDRAVRPSPESRLPVLIQRWRTIAKIEPGLPDAFTGATYTSNGDDLMERNAAKYRWPAGRYLVLGKPARERVLSFQNVTSPTSSQIQLRASSDDEIVVDFVVPAPTASIAPGPNSTMRILRTLANGLPASGEWQSRAVLGFLNCILDHGERKFDGIDLRTILRDLLESKILESYGAAGVEKRLALAAQMTRLKMSGSMAKYMEALIAFDLVHSPSIPIKLVDLVGPVALSFRRSGADIGAWEATRLLDLALSTRNDEIKLTIFGFAQNTLEDTSRLREFLPWIDNPSKDFRFSVYVIFANLMNEPARKPRFDRQGIQGEAELKAYWRARLSG
jgi:hypothetical protein